MRKNKKQFGYLVFDDNGEAILSTYNNEYRDMLMDVRVYRMHKDEVKSFGRNGEECAVLLLSGKIKYEWEGKKKTCRRISVFKNGPYALHTSSNVLIKVTALADTEILVQYTKNDNKFESHLYVPKECDYKKSSYGKFGDVARRKVNTIFDKDIEPNSNMVLGEVLNEKGNWSGYLPHRHPQPELYYFKFDRPEGFGASFVGDDVYKSRDNSFAAIPGGKLHPQAVAPGYSMYTTWMIRHLDNNPWLQSSRFTDPSYEWLNNVSNRYYK